MQIDGLVRLQELEDLLVETKNSDKKDEIKSEIILIKAQLPFDILNRFYRLYKRNGNAVVVANGGVCHGCFLNLPSSQASSMNHSNTLNVCQNCGRFIYMDSVEAVTIS